MLLRLSPAPVRPPGHAVHRAPDAERNQHPGYGAAGHIVFRIKKKERKKEKRATHFNCCSKMWSQVRKRRRRDVGNFQCNSYILVSLQVPVQPAPIGPLPLQCAAPVCRLPGCGSDLSGHGLHSGGGGGGGGGGGRSNKKRPDHAAGSTLKWGRQTFPFFFLAQISAHKLLLLSWFLFYCEVRQPVVLKSASACLHATCNTEVNTREVMMMPRNKKKRCLVPTSAPLISLRVWRDFTVVD